MFFWIVPFSLARAEQVNAQQHAPAGVKLIEDASQSGLIRDGAANLRDRPARSLLAHADLHAPEPVRPPGTEPPGDPDAIHPRLLDRRQVDVACLVLPHEVLLDGNDNRAYSAPTVTKNGQSG
jgi:hypothetical protein